MSENQSKNIVNEWVSANTNRLSEIQSKNPDLYSVVNSALSYLSSYLGGEKIEAQAPIVVEKSNYGIPNDILKIVENLYVEGLTIDNNRIEKLPDDLKKKVELNQNLPITFRYENRKYQDRNNNTNEYNVVYLIYGDKFEIVVFSDRFYISSDFGTYEKSFAEGDTNFKPIITALPFERSPIWKELDFVPQSDLKKAYNVVRLKQKKDPNYKKYLKWLFNLFGVVYSIKIKVGSDEWKIYMNTLGRSIETNEIELAQAENIYVYYFSLFEKYRNIDVFKNFDIAVQSGTYKVNDGLVYTLSDMYLTPDEIENSFYEYILIGFRYDLEYSNLKIPKLIDESDFYLGQFLQPKTKVILTPKEKARLDELQAKEDTNSLTSNENLEYEKLVEKYRQTDDYKPNKQADDTDDTDDFQDLLDDIENLDI